VATAVGQWGTILSCGRIVPLRRRAKKVAAGLIPPGRRHALQRVDGMAISRACKLGFEGIVSKRLSALYRFGPSRDWLKVKTRIDERAQRDQAPRRLSE
jgi:hypothetical protein